MESSVRDGGNTKNRQERRTIALPAFIVKILLAHREAQRTWRARHGWKSEGIVYVFGTRYDTVQQAQVIRDQFRVVVEKAGIPGSWTPRELRHSFVSLMSDKGAPPLNSSPISSATPPPPRPPPSTATSSGR